MPNGLSSPASDVTVRELKHWLHAASASDGVAKRNGTFLGARADGLSTGSRRSLRFVLAVLRDIYADDFAVWLWFVLARRELSGARPIELLVSGRTAELEALAARLWNEHVPRPESGIAELEEVVARQWNGAR